MILVFQNLLAYNRLPDGGVEPMNQPAQTPGAPPAPRPAKPYSTPTLTTFGSVARLTQGHGRSVQDGNGMRDPGGSVS